ncbi:MAG: MAPEG family protein [Pseudomonadota bacterium]
MTPITLLYAGVLGLLSVVLANYVLRIRVNAARYPDWKEPAAVRTQANFVENVPLALLLLYLVETAGAPGSVVHAFGVALVVFRCLHAVGLARYPGANYPRLIGAQGTFVVLSMLASAALLLSFAGA